MVRLTVDDGSGFGDAARPDAAGANSHPLVGFAIEYPHALKVRVPAAFGQIVSVTHPVTINRAFIADFTALRHSQNLQLR
jgi:hypothetical protein